MSPQSSSTADLAEALRSHVPGFRTRGAWFLLFVLVVGDILLIGGSLAFDVTRGLFGTVGGLVVVPVAVLLVRRQRPEWAIHLLLSTIWVIGVWLAATGPGLYGTPILFVLLMPVLGGLFCGVGGAWVWSTVTVLTLLGITGLHCARVIDLPPGDLPGPIPRARTFLVLAGISIGATIGFLHLHRTALRSLVRALDALRVENAERMRAEQAARVAAETQARFLATMSHEIRTPLNGVVCAARLIEDAPDVDRRRELSRTLVESAEGLLGLVNNVLDWSRLQHDTLDLTEEAIDLRRLAEQCTRSLELIAREKGLDFTLAVDASVPAFVAGDYARLGQVLTNLVGNAVKFTEAGRVEVSVAEVDACLHIRVVDSGVGVDLSDDRARAALFSPFSQADSTSGRRFEGSGLGLAITHELVQRMGGHIEVDSSPGHGAEFRVVIPSVPAEAPSGTLEVVGGLASGSTGVRLKVLIVEDNAVNLELQTMLLERLGHVVRAVDGGGLAVEAVFGERFDLVLMDCQMPGMDGLMATRLIRRGPPAAAEQWIVGLSADARPEARDEALGAGMDGYLTKPLQLEAFAKAVRTRIEAGLLDPMGGTSQ
mgnify:CR=1 FL=1